MHYTWKAEIWEHVNQLGFPHTSSVEAAFFYNNFSKFGDAMSITKREDGSLLFGLPILTEADSMPGFDVKVTGEPAPSFALSCVLCALNRLAA